MNNGVTKTYTEKTFDKMFSQKEIIDYQNLSGEMGRRDKQIIKWLLSYGVKNKYCLDIGPGTGRWLQFLKDNEAANLCAIDISEESLKRCSSLCNKTQKADIEKDDFIFESDYFDIIISFMTLEHLRDPSKFLSEIFRVSKNGTLVLMTIPNIVSFTSRIRVLLGFLPKAVSSDDTHVKFYTKKELIKLFEPFNSLPQMIPTSYSLHPFNIKKLRIPSNRFTSSLDDHLLFSINIAK